MRKFKNIISVITFQIGVDILGFPLFHNHKVNIKDYNYYNPYYNSFKRYIKTPTN